MKFTQTISLSFVLISLATSIYAQGNSNYQKHLSEAKEYENQKKWIYALDAYYDALEADESSENKQEAYKRYKALAEAIESGNPGLGKYNKFALYDEWKNLLIDTERYGSSICIYNIIIGNLEEESIDYKSKTATYSAKIHYEVSDRYKKTIGVVENGFKAAYREDWEDIPNEWPLHSVSALNLQETEEYNFDGGLMYDYAYGGRTEPCGGFVPMSSYQDLYNSFAAGYIENYEEIIGYDDEPPYATLYKCKFNIIDEEGKTLVEPEELFLGQDDKAIFSDLSPEIVELIDNGKAFLNLVAISLNYGCHLYNRWSRNFSEKQISNEKIVCITWPEYIDNLMVNIDGHTIQMMKTEVTQFLYETVMGENPSNNKGENLPVECVSLYDAIYFCNKLSEMTGLTPVYSIAESTNVEYWNYTPHQGDSITATINENSLANGFRLPSIEEWTYAAKGGNDYPENNNYEDVAWGYKNSGDHTHPVAQKIANGYGLYDMYGNVWEWPFSHVVIGGSYDVNGFDFRTNENNLGEVITCNKRYVNVGFRIVRSTPQQ